MDFSFGLWRPIRVLVCRGTTIIRERAYRTTNVIFNVIFIWFHVLRDVHHFVNLNYLFISFGNCIEHFSI
jgi:hypothetical protein